MGLLDNLQNKHAAGKPLAMLINNGCKPIGGIFN